MSLHFLALLALQSMSAPHAMPQWLAGSWTTEAGADEWTEEWWTPPKGGIMLGAGRTGKAEALGSFEHMRIVSEAGGRLSFCALPQGKNSTCFRAVSVDATSVTFENPAHDYPQRISYKRDGEGIIAETSDIKGGRLQRWRYRRLSN